LLTRAMLHYDTIFYEAYLSYNLQSRKEIVKTESLN
jgi:hypothetical protein